jgi:hypothetical protein
MAASPCVPGTAEDLQGCKYLHLLGPLFAHLHAAGRERDRAGAAPGLDLGQSPTAFGRASDLVGRAQ